MNMNKQIKELEEGCFRNWEFNKQEGYCHNKTLCPKCEAKLQTLQECKKMFEDYNKKLKKCVKNYNIPSDPLLKLDIKDDIDKLSKEVMGE